MIGSVLTKPKGFFFGKYDNNKQEQGYKNKKNNVCCGWEPVSGQTKPQMLKTLICKYKT